MIIPQSIVAASLFQEVVKHSNIIKTKSSQPWTKNRRNTLVKHLESKGYGRRTFSKKLKEIKKYANDFAQ